jgi:hypothetical protein
VTARVIRIEPLAPAKPAFGADCNGRGVCCLAEPCPLGVLLSGRRTGACDWVQWDGGQQRYRCGAADVAARRHWPPGTRMLATALEAAARRWISAGSGCDCTLEVARAADPPRSIR